ncbi:hypothetical protein HY357_04415 [Candidatus Roizmanbacteria bacterium]|nr:hypothetical protein [Candidatus Roizmanbacteria bacterium]
MEIQPLDGEKLGDIHRRAAKLALLLDEGIKYPNDVTNQADRVFPDEVYIIPIWQILVLKASHHLPTFIKAEIQSRLSK